MKKLFLTFLLLALLSCKKDIQESIDKMDETNTGTETQTPQTPQELGLSIFEGKGNCISCHQTEKSSIGPSVKEIAKIYTEQKSNIVSFLKGEGTPIVDPNQYEIMKANFAITKAMSDEELKGLEAYIYSVK